MIIDGIEYVPLNSANSNIRIVVLQRGWIVVGRYSRDGDNCIMTGASVVRVWGTTKGLGELAESGPTSSTKLDECKGRVEFHRLTEVLTLNCEESTWKKHVK